MRKVQVAPIPESLQTALPQLIRDFKTAVSYVSFYSTDSPFVVQSVQKLHKDLVKFLTETGLLVLYPKNGKLLLNDWDFSQVDVLLKTMEDKECPGIVMEDGLAYTELVRWLKRITLPVTRKEDEPVTDSPAHLREMTLEENQTLEKTESKPHTLVENFPLEANVPPVPSSQESKPSVAASAGIVTSVPSPIPTPASRVVAFPSPAAPEKISAVANEALLNFLAEAWQFAQLQRKYIDSSPEMTILIKAFEKLFDRLLGRLEKASPQFEGICQWFKAPSGELLENKAVEAMVPLLEVAVKNDWTTVLFDPATAGLVNDCLAQWGAEGKIELVEKAVDGISSGLSGDRYERELALTHLMDARPWVHHKELLGRVLDRLNSLLSRETYPGLYQSGLLLAWDLIEPALETKNEPSVLTLLSTLHFHADEDLMTFPERSRIARHWLFERSNPTLVRKLVRCAYQADRLKFFPLLGEMAAPLLLEDCFNAKSTEKMELFNILSQIKEPLRSVLCEKLPDLKTEAEVRTLIPILRISGMDPALSLQLSAWMGRGNRELKLNLIGLIEEIKDPAGGPALRLALFDDEEEIAAMAARVLGKIGFNQSLPVLFKAAHMRTERYGKNDQFLISVCQALGDLGDNKACSFLQDIARKKPLLKGKTCSVPVRLAAIDALTKLNKPEAWQFVETLMGEKNPELQDALEKLINERSELPS